MNLTEEKMVQAVDAKEKFDSKNTKVRVYEGMDLLEVMLYDTTIMKMKLSTGEKKFSLGGWNTNATRRRLNALGCNVCQRNGVPMRNGVEWWSDF